MTNRFTEQMQRKLQALFIIISMFAVIIFTIFISYRIKNRRPNRPPNIIYKPENPYTIGQEKDFETLSSEDLDSIDTTSNWE